MLQLKSIGKIKSKYIILICLHLSLEYLAIGLFYTL